MPSIFGRGTALSKGLAGTANFNVLTVWINTSTLTHARWRLEMRGDTGSAQSAPGFQTANNVDTPDAAAQLGSAAFLDSEGVQYGTEADLQSAIAGKTWIRFGGLVKQDADGGIQGCTLMLRVDYKVK